MTRKSVYALLLGVAVVAGGCQKKDAAPAPATSPAATMTEDEKAVYALGAAIGQQVAQQVKALNLSPAEMETLKKALAASLAGEKPEYDIAAVRAAAPGAGRDACRDRRRRREGEVGRLPRLARPRSRGR